MSRIGWLAMVLVVCAGCSEVSVSSAEWTDDLTAADLPERTFRDVSWERLFRLGGTLQDTLFWNPYHAVATDEGVVVLDAVARRVVAIGADGGVAWRFGARGGGPTEFEVPSDIATDPVGNIHVLDRGLLRVTVLDPGGRLVRIVSLDEGPGLPDRFAVVGTDEIVLIAPTAAEPIWRYGPDGRLLSTDPFPWDPFLRIPAIPRVFVTGAGRADGGWAAAFGYGTGLFLMRQAATTSGRLPVPELVVFPRMTTRQLSDGRILRRVSDPDHASLSITGSPERIYVLFAGATELARRLVDSYDRATGAYIETFVLPHAARNIAWGDGTLYLVRSDPYPAVEAWRPASEPLP